MCLWVGHSSVLQPIHEVECVKELWYYYGKWRTPYQYAVLVPDTGWFMPASPAKRRMEFKPGHQIGAGYLHVYSSAGRRKARTELPKHPQSDRSYTFLACARDVVAVNMSGSEMVCKALYIPAFDLTGAHRHVELIYK